MASCGAAPAPGLSGTCQPLGYESNNTGRASGRPGVNARDVLHLPVNAVSGWGWTDRELRVEEARLPVGRLLVVHPAFPGKDVSVRKKAPPSRKSEAIATHAAPGVNGHGIHGIHGIHGPQPNPQNFFPLHPHTFLGGATQLPGRGCGGPCFPCFPWLIRGGVEGSRIVPSITCSGIPGRTLLVGRLFSGWPAWPLAPARYGSYNA